MHALQKHRVVNGEGGQRDRATILVGGGGQKGRQLETSVANRIKRKKKFLG